MLAKYDMIRNNNPSGNGNENNYKELLTEYSQTSNEE